MLNILAVVYVGISLTGTSVCVSTLCINKIETRSFETTGEVYDSYSYTSLTKPDPRQNKDCDCQSDIVVILFHSIQSIYSLNLNCQGRFSISIPQILDSIVPINYGHINSITSRKAPVNPGTSVSVWAELSVCSRRILLPSEHPLPKRFEADMRSLLG